MNSDDREQPNKENVSEYGLLFNKVKSILSNKNTLGLTVITAATSTMIYAFSYAYQCQVLRSWNIPIEFVGNLENSKNFYFVVFGLFYCISTTLFQNYVYNIQVPKRKLKYLLKYAKQIIKKTNKTIVKRTARNNSNNSNAVIRHKIGRNLKTMRKNYRILRKESIRILNHRFLLPACLIAVCGLIPSWALFTMMTSEKDNIQWVSLLGTLILNIVAATLLASITARHEVKIFRKKLESNAKFSWTATLEKFNKINKYIIDTCNYTLETMLTEKFLKLGQIIAIIATGVITIATEAFMAGNLNKYTHNNFWICNVKQQPYAAFYIDSSNVILKEASINNESIKIDLNKHIQEDPHGQSCYNFTFQTVEWLE